MISSNLVPDNEQDNDQNGFSTNDFEDQHLSSNIDPDDDDLNDDNFDDDDDLDTVDDDLDADDDSDVDDYDTVDDIDASAIDNDTDLNETPEEQESENEGTGYTGQTEVKQPPEGNDATYKDKNKPYIKDFPEIKPSTRDLGTVSGVN